MSKTFFKNNSDLILQAAEQLVNCLASGHKILIFGNGGVKDAKSWQQSTTLAPYVKLLIDTSRFIQSRIKDGTIVLVDKEIIGNLNFTRNEKK